MLIKVEIKVQIKVQIKVLAIEHMPTVEHAMDA